MPSEWRTWPHCKAHFGRGSVHSLLAPTVQNKKPGLEGSKNGQLSSAGVKGEDTVDNQLTIVQLEYNRKNSSNAIYRAYKTSMILIFCSLQVNEIALTIMSHLFTENYNRFVNVRLVISLVKLYSRKIALDKSKAALSKIIQWTDLDYWIYWIRSLIQTICCGDRLNKTIESVPQRNIRLYVTFGTKHVCLFVYLYTTKIFGLWFSFSTKK